MKIRTVIIALFSAIILLGCTNNQQDENANTDETIYEQTSDTSESNRNPTNEEIANHLADIAKSIPDVENAFAVVAGPYAVVGIDVDKSIERERVGTIKFSVSEALRDDKYGKTAVVVADADGTERIRRMAEKIETANQFKASSMNLPKSSPVTCRYSRSKNNITTNLTSKGTRWRKLKTTA